MGWEVWRLYASVLKGTALQAYVGARPPEPIPANTLASSGMECFVMRLAIVAWVHVAGVGKAPLANPGLPFEQAPVNPGACNQATMIHNANLEANILFA